MARRWARKAESSRFIREPAAGLHIILRGDDYHAVYDNGVEATALEQGCAITSASVCTAAPGRQRSSMPWH